METCDSFSLMVMYEDESVEVRYRNGTQVQLAPCGCEFMLVKAPDLHGHHPLQPTEHVRQRTRFTISKYKEMMVAALAFRNKYASRPYLPEELIPADHKKPFFSIESDVTWPEFSSVETELGPGGSITVRSEEGRAWLELSPSGEDFSVDFACGFSQPPNHRQDIQSSHKGADCSSESRQQASSLICDNVDDQSKPVHQRRGRRSEPTQTKSCSQTNSTAQLKPEQRYQSTTVVQHHSCCAVPPSWSYPLSLARHQWASHFSECKEAEGSSGSNHSDNKVSVSNSSHEGRRVHLPPALPLTCSSPHWHRWKFKDPLVKEEESDLPTGLVKIVWCQAVTYRVLSGAVPVIEIYPGDGSVIRSNGVLNSYFTHHKPRLQAEEVKDLTYHLNRLPPDVPGQVYSLYSIVSRASRILACYNQAKLKCPATPSCLQEDGHFFNSTLSEQNPSSDVFMKSHVDLPQTADNLSNLAAAELEKIKRFNFLLENSHLLRIESKQRNSKESSPEITPDPVNEDYVAEALQRTSKAIQDIDAVISAATLT
ncbi:uncharacterized protein C5orf34 homolog [Austrofundulus limnaeus]|uniref:Uncharacterized protein C5orf34 homolog n=1 Tax=Austrofundulus limnaeus TaxID=52670 RepID=A0A2I4B4K5_AUSLI|nr:PREDICTED: uncharacterized protein C5orf34 homolog [Austrofundulus limnaeus]